MTDLRPDFRRLALMLLAALVAYSNSFRTGLIFDSYAAVIEDARVHAATWQNISALATQDYWTPALTSWLYRPLTKLSYLFNYAILGSGANPFSYHAVNFLLHAVNVTLVYLLGLTLFRERERGGALALATAAVWALHPVLTEDVTNIVGRADLLAGLGVLCGLVCHIRLGGRGLWLLVLCAAVGIFSKENTISLIAAMAVYDLAWRPADWRKRLPNYAAVAAVFALFFVCRYHFLSPVLEENQIFADNPLNEAGFWTARITAMKVLGKYLALLIWPVKLSADYSFNQIPLGADWQAFAALAAYLAIAGGTLFCLRGRKEIFFLGAFFLVCLAPMSNVFLLIGTIMGERFLYLPAIGFAGVLVLGVEAMFRRTPKAAVATVVAICAAFAARTFWRNFDWQTDQSLWVSTVQTSPNSYRVHSARAYWMIRDNSSDKQTISRELDRAVAILDPLPDGINEIQPFLTAGYWHRVQGDGPGALAFYLRAQRIDNARGALFSRRNRAQGREVPKQGTPNLYLELGRTYKLLHDTAKAAEALKYGRSLNLDPAFSEELAAAFYTAGDTRAAAIALMEGLMLDLRQRKFASDLADLYRQAMPQSCAVLNGSINLNCAIVHEHACTAAGHVFRMHADGGASNQAAQVAATALGMGCSPDPFR